MTLECKQHCPDHDRTVERITVIETHVLNGVKWRASIVAIAATLVINIIIAVYWYGQLAKTVEIDGARLRILEEIHPRAGIAYAGEANNNRR